MSTKDEMLKMLSSFHCQYISGEEIGKKIGVTRAAVNKAANSLKKDGYNIKSKTNQGYMIKEDFNFLSQAAIESMTKNSVKIEVFDEIESTNDYAKTLSPGDTPIAIIADCQTKGRGRLGRSFDSPKGAGLYLSLAIRPDFAIDQALYITMASAVGTMRAIDKVCGVTPKIKWVNDLYLNDYKIAGILTEAVTNFETGTTGSIVTGIGINCFPYQYPEEIASIAGPVSEKKNSFSRNLLAATVIDNLLDLFSNLNNKDFLNEYRKNCFVIGRTVTIKNFGNEKRTLCKVLDIDNNGGLIIEPLEGSDKGKRLTVISGEISLENFL